MASPAANAIRYDLAQRKIAVAIEKIYTATGIIAPPPYVKFDSIDHRHALEAERMATYLNLIADTLLSEKKS